MTDVPYINHILDEDDHSQYVEQSGIALAHEVDDKEHLLVLDEDFSDELGAYYMIMYPLGEGLKEASGLSRKKKRYFQLRIQSMSEEGERACELVWSPIKDDRTPYEHTDIIGEMLLEKVEQDNSNLNRLIFHGKKLDAFGDANKTQTTRAVTFLRNKPLKTAKNINTIIDNCTFIDKKNIKKSELGSKIPIAQKITDIPIPLAQEITGSEIPLDEIPFAQEITGGRTTRRRKRINRKKVSKKSRKKIIKRKRKTLRKASKKSKRRGRKSRKNKK